MYIVFVYFVYFDEQPQCLYVCVLSCLCLLTLSDIMTLTGSVQWEETQGEIFCLLLCLKMSE